MVTKAISWLLSETHTTEDWLVTGFWNAMKILSSVVAMGEKL